MGTELFVVGVIQGDSPQDLNLVEGSPRIILRALHDLHRPDLLVHQVMDLPHRRIMAPPQLTNNLIPPIIHLPYMRRVVPTRLIKLRPLILRLLTQGWRRRRRRVRVLRQVPLAGLHPRPFLRLGAAARLGLGLGLGDLLAGGRGRGGCAGGAPGEGPGFDPAGLRRGGGARGARGARGVAAGSRAGGAHGGARGGGVGGPRGACGA